MILHLMTLIQKRKERGLNLILNTVWETTRIPSHWFPLINEFDAVCVPSLQNIESLKNSGVKVPVFLVPHGADTEFFKPENQKIQAMDNKRKVHLCIRIRFPAPKESRRATTGLLGGI